MRAFSSVFSQILNLFPRLEFEQLVSKHRAERHARGFTCWTQFVSMLFCHLGRAQSLREICEGLASIEGKLSHLGAHVPKRSTLSYANAHRPWPLFEELFHALLERCREIAPKHRFRFKNKLISMDATTIDLCLSAFDWASFRQTKGGIKVHLLLDHDGHLPMLAVIKEAKIHESKVARFLEFPRGSILVFDRAYNDFEWFAELGDRQIFFVTRSKDRTRYEVMSSSPVSGPVIADEQIVMVKQYPGLDPVVLRRIEIRTAEGEELIFLTNHFNLAASTVAAIYKERWQIETFFRAIKQNLRIKTFVGTSPNAVHIQIWTALIAMLVLRYLQLKSQTGWSLSNLLALLRFNLFAYRDLWSWLENPGSPPQPHEQYLLPQFG